MQLYSFIYITPFSVAMKNIGHTITPLFAAMRNIGLLEPLIKVTRLKCISILLLGEFATQFACLYTTNRDLRNAIFLIYIYPK